MPRGLLIPRPRLDRSVLLPSLGQGSAQFVQVSVQGLRRPLRWAAGAALVLGLLVLLPRLVIEAQWFAQFDAVTVVLRRWLLQCLAFALVLTIAAGLGALLAEAGGLPYAHVIKAVALMLLIILVGLAIFRWSIKK